MKIYKIISILFLLLFSINVYSQTIYLGAYAGSNNRPGNLYTTFSPYASSHDDGRYQIIYTKSELNTPKDNPWTGNSMDAGDNIKGIGFFVYEKHSTQAFQNFTIKIGHTSLTNFPSGWITGLQTVYSGNVSTINNSWNDCGFSPYFQWNGVDNIVIEICFDNNSHSSSSDYVSRTSDFATHYAYSTANSSSGCSLTSYVTNTAKPCIRINYVDGVLPIELSKVNIECNNGKTVINWSSLTETNNDYYIIEKSHNAIDYTIVNYVKGAGNSNEPLNYSYIDYKATPDQTYYKLSQKDFDGSISKLKVLQNKCLEARDEKLIINHIGCRQNNINVNFISKNKEKYIITVFNIQGQTVSKKSSVTSIGDNNVDIHINENNSSMYFVQINTNTQKILKKVILINE